MRNREEAYREEAKTPQYAGQGRIFRGPEIEAPCGGMTGGQSERPTKAASITLALESLATLPDAIEDLLGEIRGAREQSDPRNQVAPAPPVPGLEMVLNMAPDEIYATTSRCHELLKELRTALIG